MYLLNKDNKIKFKIRMFYIDLINHYLYQDITNYWFIILKMTCNISEYKQEKIILNIKAQYTFIGEYLKICNI